MTVVEHGSSLDALTAIDGDADSLPTWRRARREQGLAALAEAGLPQRRDEPWHYFPTAKLTDLLDGAVAPRSAGALDPGQVDIMAGDLGCSRLVFVNGFHDVGASRLSPSDGVTVSALSAVADSDSADHTGPPSPSTASGRTDGTVALNAAAAVDGAMISVSAEATEATIHVVHVAVPDADKTYGIFPHTLISLAPGATATVVESFIGFRGPALVDSVTTIDLAEGSRLAYHRLQSEGRSTVHLGRVDAVIGAGADLTTTSVSLGAELSRTAFDVTLAGDESSVTLDGLYLPRSGQHLDHTLTVQHSANRTTSEQRFKGVVDDDGRGSFTGHVIVDPDTAGTTAHQSNHNILLSSRAEADTRPWLEILADDVRCTHGATVGRLDDEAVFYLRSRGIPEATAREMLIEGFAGEIIDGIDLEPLRDHLRSRITSSRKPTATTRG
ncbi:MAG: Fe-S cluster assembly protein SufD [Acidimicrobiales bacterium]|nr:Fe-S cluster assembly protein SufD [Acidimicrobiales bacterium]